MKKQYVWYSADIDHFLILNLYKHEFFKLYDAFCKATNRSVGCIYLGKLQELYMPQYVWYDSQKDRIYVLQRNSHALWTRYGVFCDEIGQLNTEIYLGEL